MALTKEKIVHILRHLYAIRRDLIQDLKENYTKRVKLARAKGVAIADFNDRTRRIIKRLNWLLADFDKLDRGEKPTKAMILLLISRLPESVNKEARLADYFEKKLDWTTLEKPVG